MITNVLVEKNPWPDRPVGPAMMKRIPNAPSKGVMLNSEEIHKAILGGCKRAKSQFDAMIAAEATA